MTTRAYNPARVCTSEQTDETLWLFLGECLTLAGRDDLRPAVPDVIRAIGQHGGWEALDEILGRLQRGK